MLLVGGAARRATASTRACASCGELPATRKKLVLAVIDALKPGCSSARSTRAARRRSRRSCERGTYVRDCVSAFPSVTPVAASAIATGLGPDEHHIPSMNWYHRGEGRYVEYGSSFPATRAFGVVRSLHDTVYNMNMAHLTRDAPDGLRAPRRRRGAHRLHDLPDLPRPPPPRALGRLASTAGIAEAAQFRHAVWGPRELFYADLFDSRNTGCPSTLGMPGQRDRHAGCVGAYLVENDLFDFLLFSLPDNDTYSHRAAPTRQVDVDRRGRPRARAHHARGRRASTPSSRTTR